MAMKLNQLIETTASSKPMHPMVHRYQRKVANFRGAAKTGASRTISKLTGSPRRIGYIGSFGGGNIGDYACLMAAKRLLSQRLTVWGPSWTERRLGRLGLAGPDVFDSVVLGGGTLIDPWHVGQVRTAIDQGLVLDAFGTGVRTEGDPVRDRERLAVWKQLLEPFRSIAVRGPDSAAFLRELGVERVSVVGDLALALTRPAPVVRTSERVVAVNIRVPRRGSYTEGFQVGMDALVSVIRSLAEDGWAVRPFAMEDMDVPALEMCLAAAGRPELPVWAGRDPEALIDMFGQCAVVFSVRLHGAVLATCAGVPTVAVNYDPKVAEFMRTMNLEDYVEPLDWARPDAILEKIHVAATRKGLGEAVWERARHWRERLETHAHAIRSSHEGSAKTE
jgi:hypothetical protein